MSLFRRNDSSYADRRLAGRRVAILVTDGFEQEELTVPRHALTKAGAVSEIVSPKPDKVRGWKHGEWGDELEVAVWIERASADDYDALLLPGGVINPDRLRRDERAVEFVRGFVEAGKPIAAICHGPWTLIEAGGVEGRELTSWPSLRADLENAGALWVDREVVVDDGLVTSRKPEDLPAFNERMLEEFAEGAHERRRVAGRRNETQRTGERNRMNGTLKLIGGAALGAGIMYLLDPDRGARRRALIRDQAVHLKKKSVHAATAKSRDLANRTRGLVAETRSKLAAAFEPEHAAFGRDGSTNGRKVASAAGGLLALLALRNGGGLGRLLGVAGGSLLMASVASDPRLRRPAPGISHRAVAERDTLAPADLVSPLV